MTRSATHALAPAAATSILAAAQAALQHRGVGGSVARGATRNASCFGVHDTVADAVTNHEDKKRANEAHCVIARAVSSGRGPGGCGRGRRIGRARRLGTGGGRADAHGYGYRGTKVGAL